MALLWGGSLSQRSLSGVLHMWVESNVLQLALFSWLKALFFKSLVRKHDKTPRELPRQHTVVARPCTIPQSHTNPFPCFSLVPLPPPTTPPFPPPSLASWSVTGLRVLAYSWEAELASESWEMCDYSRGHVGACSHGHSLRECRWHLQSIVKVKGSWPQFHASSDLIQNCAGSVLPFKCKCSKKAILQSAVFYSLKSLVKMHSTEKRSSLLYKLCFWC